MTNRQIQMAVLIQDLCLAFIINSAATVLNGGFVDFWSYFAGRYAGKTAVFKALARLIPEKSFDFRIVETMRRPDGSPAITHDGPMLEVLHMANVDKLLVSISNEGSFSIAFVTAISGRNSVGSSF